MIRRTLGLLCFLFSVGPALSQDIAVQSNRSRIEMVKDFDLKGNARSEFRQFKRKAEFFGTIYVNRPERTAGAYWNANSFALSDEYARELCHLRSKNAEYCVLYARMRPKGYAPSTSGVTLSRAANKEFREYRKLQNESRFGAFAVSDNGAVGYSWAEATAFAAEEEALRRCQKAARKIMRQTPDELKPIISRPERQGCRMIHRTN